MIRVFNKIYIVPKLNAKDEPLVGKVVRLVECVATCCEPRIRVLSHVEFVDKETLVIAVGGDGTMLEAMRIAAIRGAHATGINLGKVGFLTDFALSVIPEFNERFGASPEEFDEVVFDQYLFNDLLSMFHNSGAYPIEERMSLQAWPTDNNISLDPNPVFNEYVLSNLLGDTIIKYHLKIDGVDAGYHRANGVIIGTPTGSTAYTLSNGGGLLYPSMNIMQIVPIAPLSMSSRPIIVPGSAVVRILVETEGTWTLKGDGRRLAEYNSLTIPFEITRYHKMTKIIHSKDWNFFNMLSNKLHWKQS